MIDNEIRIHKSINHPNIISLIEYEEFEQKLYIVLELAENSMIYLYTLQNKNITEKMSMKIVL